MGVYEIEGLHVAIVSRKGTLLANSVPSASSAETKKKYLEFVTKYGRDEGKTAFQAKVASILVRLLNDAGDDVWEESRREIPLDGLSAVLRELRDKTSPGETLSYGELAERAYGKRQAARSVGTAMRTNPFPLLVPCHRVVKSDGVIGEYSGSGGVATKRLLLDKEKRTKFKRKR